MNSNQREGLVAKCGLDCSICELYLAGTNQELYAELISLGIPKDKLPCGGCNATGGKCSLQTQKCSTYKCAVERDLRYCFECEDFPCNKYQPYENEVAKYPHNLKVFNLILLKNYGIDYFLEKSQEIKDTYYKGKFPNTTEKK